MSRKQAKEKIDMTEFEKSMEGKIAEINIASLSESPQAYKNIHEVIKKQEDLGLIKRKRFIKSLATIKG